MLRRRCRLCNLVVLLLFVSLLLFSGCQQQNTDATDNQTTEITVTDDSGAGNTILEKLKIWIEPLCTKQFSCISPPF
jgi:ABC-type Fe3+-citrate transport system substrate-binding protein